MNRRQYLKTSIGTGLIISTTGCLEWLPGGNNDEDSEQEDAEDTEGEGDESNDSESGDEQDDDQEQEEDD